MDSDKNTRLKRQIYPIPDFVKEALLREGLMDKYLERPPYQQNDYVGWITRAKLEATKIKRLTQMLQELKQGDKYMNMNYTPRKTT